jgi:phospholipid transport system substrate-binding protein
MHAALILAVALTAASSATEALKARDAELRASLPPAGQPVTQAQREKAEELLVKIVDFHAISQKTLGKTWAETPEAKRKKFEDAFVKRFKRATSDQVDRFRTAQVSYDAEQKVGENVKVATTVGTGDDAAKVAYLMAQGPKGWLIEDIIIDDVSNVDNYRKSFAKIIAKDGLDGLIAKLEKEKGTDAAAPATDGGAAPSP